MKSPAKSVASEDNINSITSICIVSVDHYICRPIKGLDPCYSEYRGSEAKQVPVIRIFGADQAGSKTCLHVHGVFPYIYIPYDGADLISAQRFSYQVATSLDLALNISLGQSSSGTQHIYKITPVKAFPFYGYHPREHQYLKIYFYNPGLIKRAADLFQNGAILNKIYQPHECHVPYILQFFIDYNLYGMSYLHVPSEVIRIRRNESDSIPPELEHKYLDPYVKRLSTSTNEVDIIASFILNRQNIQTGADVEHSNPGISSIWTEERIRRAAMPNDMPPVEIPPSQDRPFAQPTESHEFYKRGLQRKLDEAQYSEQTLNDTSLGLGLSRRFNLSTLLSNAVYPAECSQKFQETLNASYVQDHLKLDTTVQFEEKTINRLSNASLDDTIVNEGLVLSLSQSQGASSMLDETLNPEECDLLDVMKKLEEGENSDIDNDSILAPLSQKIQMSQPSQSTANKSIVLDKKSEIVKQLSQSMEEEEIDSDDDILNEFSMILDYPESTNVDQLDGANDNTPKKKSPKKFTRQLIQTTTPSTPKRNKPVLDITVSNSPTSLKKITEKKAITQIVDNSNSSEDETPEPKRCKTNSNSEDQPKTPPYKFRSLQKINLGQLSSSLKKASKACNVGLSETKLKTEKINSPAASIKRRLPFTNANKAFDLEKSYITCRYTRQRTKESNDGLNEEDGNNQNFASDKKFSAKCLVKMDVIPDINDLLKNIPNNHKKDDEKKTNDNSGQQIILIEDSSNESVISIDHVNDDSRIISKTKDSSNVNSISKNQTKDSPVIKNMHSGVKDIQFEKKCRVRMDVMSNIEELLKEYNQKKSKASDKKTEELKNKEIEEQNKSIDLFDQSTIEIISNSPNVSQSPMEHIANHPMILSQGNEAASQFDKEKNFYPQPGPSHLNFYENVEIPGYYTPVKPKSAIKNTPGSTKTIIHSPVNTRLASLRQSANISSPAFSEKSDQSFDLKVTSFYDRSFMVDSSSGSSSPEILPEKSNTIEVIDKICKLFNEHKNTIHITPATIPPTYDEVMESLHTYNIPEVVNTGPFYGNPNDKHGRKEVGHFALHIPGNKIGDLDEFHSNISGLMGLSQRRKTAFEEIVSKKEANRMNSISIREFIASERVVNITPHNLPPTKHEAKIWLKARAFMSGSTEEKSLYIDEDSPVEVRREKLKMIVNGNESDENVNDDDDNESRVSEISFNLSPGTPEFMPSHSKELFISDTTPKSRLLNKSTQLTTPKQSEKRRKACLSLTSKMNAIKRRNIQESIDVFEKKFEDSLSQTKDNFSKTESCNESALKLSQNSNASSKKSSESVSSDVIKQMLERSSFRNDLNLDPRNSSLSALLNNTCGFKMNLENYQDIKCSQEYNYLTVMSLEIFVQTRGQLKPDPDYDRIVALFYRITNNVPDNFKDSKVITGILVTDDLPKYVAKDVNILRVTDEKEMLLHFVGIVAKYDPDIFAAYEIEMASWGYIIQRGFILELNLPPLLSRVPSQKSKGFTAANQDDPTNPNASGSELKLPGRILLDVWRLMRSEIALTSYTFENVMYHILHRRYPLHSHNHLTRLWNRPFNRWIVLDYFLDRNKGLFELLDQLDLIGRTSELAKLFGIQFFEVLSRGSQFRVESMMLRMAKPNNLVPVSPSIKQRAHMRAPEYLPLILEPQSRFYTDPVIVLDFQSLYPSVIIGYNYCFSTCLGRVEHLAQSTPFEFGASQLRVSPTLLKSLIAKDLVTISPCGVVFLKSTVREGILPRMLREILDARLMVKQSMKLHKKNVLLQRVLHSRQLGLKLIANVTYGYTAANFSGRMPCVEVGDSVVSKGRETLERAIKMVEMNKEWNVQVVYGDTDSLFVLVPGRSKEEAFRIGTEIVDRVTEDNPNPVKLKLEKVYQPCILQTKKRYVGYMYETPEQKDPVYEAKGIETVRRDGCPIVARMLEKTLRILFSTKDVSIVKRFICRQFTNLLSGNTSIQDLVFAKEFRGISGYKPGACVPALELTRKWKIIDPRAEPRRGERVPYVIVNGPPGVPLIRLVRSPHEVLADSGLKINAMYYITKVIIPPLNRCLLLIGADAHQWFADLPRKTQYMLTLSAADRITQPTANKKSTISQYFSTTNCVAECGTQTKAGLCENCAKNTHRSAVVLSRKISDLDRKVALVNQICQSCCGRQENTDCMSLDCPVLFVLNKSKREHIQVEYFRDILSKKFK